MKGEVCTICGKELKDFGGHYVPIIVMDGEEPFCLQYNEHEYHCFECDPITDLGRSYYICGKKTSRAAGHVPLSLTLEWKSLRTHLSLWCTCGRVTSVTL